MYSANSTSHVALDKEFEILTELNKYDAGDEARTIIAADAANAWKQMLKGCLSILPDNNEPAELKCLLDALRAGKGKRDDLRNEKAALPARKPAADAQGADTMTETQAADDTQIVAAESMNTDTTSMLEDNTLEAMIDMSMMGRTPEFK